MARSPENVMGVPPRGALSPKERATLNADIENNIRLAEAKKARAGVVAGEIAPDIRPAPSHRPEELPNVMVEPAYAAETLEKARLAVAEYYSLSKKERAARQAHYQSSLNLLMEVAPEELLQFKLGKNDRALVEKRIADLSKRREAAPEAPSAPEVARPAEAERPPAEPEAAKKWIWAREIGKGLAGAGASILGVKFFYDGVQYIREQRAKRKATSEVDAILEDIDRAFTPQARAAARAGESIIFSEAKSQTLFAKLEELVKSGTLTGERRDQLLVELRDITVRRAKAEEAARADLNKETGNAMNDYLETKISKARVAREFLNTAAVLTGLQMARGAAMLTMAAVERSAKKWKEQELAARAGRFAPDAEEHAPGFWQKLGKTLWEGNVKDASREFARSITAQGATKERVSTFARAMDFGKALGTVARFVGVGLAIHAEQTEGGISQSIENLVKGWENQGSGVFLDNLRRNVYHVFHLHPKGERGAETLQTHTQVHPKAVDAAHATAPEAPHVETQEEFLSKHGVLKSLVDEHKGVLDGHKLTVTLGDKTHGFEEVQQGLRRVVLQDLNVKGDHLTDLEMDRVEKIIKILTHTAHHERLHAQWFDQALGQDKLDELLKRAHEVVHLDDHGDLVVEDVEKFKTMMPELEGLADKYHVSMMEYINHTRRGILQEIMDKRAAGAGQAHITVDDFDKSPRVQAAEHAHALYEAKAFAGGEVQNLQVAHHGASVTFNAAVDGVQVELHMDHGRLVEAVNLATGDHLPLPEEGWHTLEGVSVPAHPITFDDPLGQSKLYDLVHEKAWHPVSPAQAPIPSGGGAPHAGESWRTLEGVVVEKGMVAPTFAAILQTKDSAGNVHFGTVPFKAQVLDKVHELSVAAFIKDPLQKLGLRETAKDLLDASPAANDLRALASVMKNHPDTGTVENFVTTHFDRLGDWFREVNKK